MRGGPIRPTAMDDDDFEEGGEFPGSTQGLRWAISGGHAPQTPPAIIGGHGQGFVVVEMNNLSARYGLRAVRVGEASHPGPPVRRMRRLVLRNGSPRSATRATQVDSETDDDRPLVRRSTDAFPGLEVEPGGAPEVYPMSDDADVEVTPQCGGFARGEDGCCGSSLSAHSAINSGPHSRVEWE